MKRKYENCQLIGTQGKLKRIATSKTKRRVMETRANDNGKQLQSSPTNITDLPPELLLEIFSWLSVREICQRVAPVCKKWNILARHQSLRMELSFSYNDISTSNVCKLLRRSPRLRRLSLKDRHDTDAILRQVCKSNRHLETLKMESCQGSMRIYKVDGNILMKILEGCPKLCNLDLIDTVVETCEFYRLLGRLDDRLKSFSIDDAYEEGVRCYLETRNQLLLQRKGLLNGESKDVEDMLALLTEKPKIEIWNITFTE
jgi:hypothetical protein